MEIILSSSPSEAGMKAARKGGELIRKALSENGNATIILATGISQLEMLSFLVKEDIDWKKVTAFHLDEYIGISASHPASFRKYLREKFSDLLNLHAFIYVNGEHDPGEECRRLGLLLKSRRIDVAFIGIGENGHLAFNDPPADFDTREPYLVVKLDEACRKQQLNEGWFGSFAEVPTKAISMSIRQIMKAQSIICTVPEKRKAEAVKRALTEPVSPMIPASILRLHPDTWLYLETDSASMLS